MLNYFEEINKLWGIYLDNLEEPKDNQLLLHIYEATGSEGRNRYRVYFGSCASYAVTDERYRKLDDGYDKWEGKLFCLLSQSRFLDFICNNTSAETYHDNLHEDRGKLKHYAFYCLNHTIDIVSFDEPIITKIE
jgi:hypothetical protein